MSGVSAVQKELADALRTLGYGDEHPVIIKYNLFATELPVLLNLAFKEIEELELERPLSPEWHMELDDVIVFLRTIMQRIAPSFSAESAHLNVNGQFPAKPSSRVEHMLDLSQLKEQVLNLGEGNAERNLQHFLTTILSMLRYLNTDLQTKIYAPLVNGKLRDNKEECFYQEEPGMSLTDIADKYVHVTEALRYLRTYLKRIAGESVTLKPWITDFFADEILDWRHSEEALTRLEQKIPLFELKIKDEIASALKKDPTSQTNKDPFFNLKLMIAGAQPVKALQNGNDMLTL